MVPVIWISEVLHAQGRESVGKPAQALCAAAATARLAHVAHLHRIPFPLRQPVSVLACETSPLTQPKVHMLPGSGSSALTRWMSRPARRRGGLSGEAMAASVMLTARCRQAGGSSGEEVGNRSRQAGRLAGRQAGWQAGRLARCTWYQALRSGIQSCLQHVGLT
jgi:hypothetical protein